MGMDGKGVAKRLVWSSLSRPAVSKVTTGLARPFGRRLPHWLTGRIPVVRRFEVAIPGTSSSFCMETDNSDIAVAVFWRGLEAWEPMTGRALVDLGRQSRTFLDVGANVGLAALLVAAVSPSTQVHAFEPVPDIFRRLERNVAINRRLSNIVAHELALSNHAGEAVMHVPGEDRGLVPTEASLQPRSQRADDVSVPVATLDEVVGQLDMRNIDLLKLDTEGTEHWVLEGAAQTVARDRPYVICEVLSDSWPQAHLGPIFLDHDYRAVHLRETGPELCAEVCGDPTYRDLDFLFVPSERWAALPAWLRALS